MGSVRFFMAFSFLVLGVVSCGNYEPDQPKAGPPGVAGGMGPAGTPCWDIDGDGRPDEEEDVNGDGAATAADCVGLPGTPGKDGANGKDGAKGATGPKGEPGTDGKDGANGASCTVSSKDHLGCVVITCGKDSSDPICDGTDGSAGATGPKGEPGTDGKDGANGAAGQDLTGCTTDAQCPAYQLCLDGDTVAGLTRYCWNGECLLSNLVISQFCDYGCSKGSCLSECTTDAQCALGDKCVSGSCVPYSCDDGSACTYDQADGNGGCLHTPVNCLDDANACTKDVCDPNVGCQHVPFTASDCDDGNGGTVDTCDALVGCVHTPVTPNCNDGIACTTDALVNGACVYTVNNAVCDDGNPATEDFCDQTKGCVNNPVAEHSVVIQCDTGHPCEVHLWAQPDLGKGYTGNDILDQAKSAPAVYGLTAQQIAGSGIKIKVRWLTQNASGTWLATTWSGDTGAPSMLDHAKVWVDGVLKHAPGSGQPKLPLEAIPGQTNTEGNWIVSTNQFAP